MTELPSLPDDILFQIVTALADPADVCRFGATCKKWHEKIHTERLSQTWEEDERGCYDDDGDLWYNLLEFHRSKELYCAANVLEFFLRFPSSVWPDGTRVRYFSGETSPVPKFRREFVLLTERLISFAKTSLRTLVEEKIECIRSDKTSFFGSEGDPQSPSWLPPTKRTTKTFPLKAYGRFFMPVYYDWEANFDKVSALMQRKDVQQVLKCCVIEAQIEHWNSNYDWPFYYYEFTDSDDYELHNLIAAMAPKQLLRKHNDEVAEWMTDHFTQLDSGSDWEKLVAMNVAMSIRQVLMDRLDDPKPADWAYQTVQEVLSVVASDVTDFISTSADEFTAEVRDRHQHLHIDEMAKDIMADLSSEAEEALGVKDKIWKFFLEDCLHDPESTPLRSTLLNNADTHSYLPLTYKLAQLLASPGTELSVYVSDDYAVVVDERQNIVYDTCNYFTGVSPSRTLSEAKEGGSNWVTKHFDFTLGGLLQPPKKGKKRKHCATQTGERTT